MNKREEQRTQTRQRILKAAHERFAESGFEKTKTVDIAASANLSHGAIFVHFKTRQDIVLNVIDEFGKELSRHIDKSIDTNRGARETLLSFTRALSKFENFYVELLQVLPKMPEAVQGAFLLLQNGFSYKLLPAIESEISENRRKQLSESGILNTWFALLHYYLMNRDWYTESGNLLDTMETKLVDDYLTLVGINL